MAKHPDVALQLANATLLRLSQFGVRTRVAQKLMPNFSAVNICLQ
jgi:hypothetical protein